MNNVISTNVKYFRNVKDYKFVPKLEENKKKEIFDTVSSALSKRMKFLDAQESADNKNKLYELNLIEPNSKSLFVDLEADVVVSLFENEHIKINAGGLGFDKKIFENAKSIESLIKDKINLTYSDDYGYLTSNLALIGNGLKISSVLDLSSLKEIGKIDQVTQNVKNLGYVLVSRGGNLYELSTSCTLGYTESEVIAEFEKTLSKLDDLESESLKLLDAQYHDEILDKADRSYATLSSCRLLNEQELKKQLSPLLCGLNLGEIEVDRASVLKLYALTRINSNITTKSDMLELANRVKNILKGGKNV